MLDSSSTSLSALATALHHPCFWHSPLLGLVCFILASKREQVRYNPCGGVCGVGYSKITGGMCYQLMPGLPWDCMTSTRFAMNEPRDGHIPSFTFVKQSKLKR